MSFSTASSFGMEHSQTTAMDDLKQLFDEQFADFDVDIHAAESSWCSCCDTSCCDTRVE